MPATRRVYLNDNIRTEHLKCSRCRTQAHLFKIEPDGSGGEVRTFVCPHCQARRLLRLRPSSGASVATQRSLPACDHGHVEAS